MKGEEIPVIKVTDTSMTDITVSERIKSDYLSKEYDKPVTSNQLDVLQGHMETLFSGDKAAVRKSFEELPELMRSLICFETWRAKGQVHGIHNDFGRHSYLQTNEIGDYYHLGDEDRINLML